MASGWNQPMETTARSNSKTVRRFRPRQPESASLAEGNARTTMSLSKLVLAMPIERAGFAMVEIGADAAIRLPPMDRMGFHYLLRGELDFAGPDGVRRRLLPGDFICLPRGAPHAFFGLEAEGAPLAARHLREIRTSEEPERLVFGASEHYACLLSGSLQTLRTAADYTVPTLPELLVIHAGEHRTASLMPSPLCEAALQGAGASAFAAGLVQLLFAQAVRTVVTGSSIAQRDIYAFRFPRIASTHRLMERHYHEPWTIQRLAAAAGMAKSSFVSAFTTAIGEPPLTRLAAIRLTEARRLLEGERTIGEIATAVGYHSQAAFTRAFRRRFGETPTAVRARLLGEALPHIPVIEP